LDKRESVLSETIFYDPDLSWLEEGRFVRIRKKNDNIKLTYKENKEQKIDSAYEIEFEVSDEDQVKKFLEKMGLVAYRQQEKKRHTLILDEIVFDIDTWPKVPSYIEIEGPDENSIKKIAELVGLDWQNAIFEDAKSIIEKHYNIPFGKMRYFTFDRRE
jgi:adenylate cyclase class 2